MYQNEDKDGLKVKFASLDIQEKWRIVIDKYFKKRTDLSLKLQISVELDAVAELLQKKLWALKASGNHDVAKNIIYTLADNYNKFGHSMGKDD
jgi:hypothetical protein